MMIRWTRCHLWTDNLVDRQTRDVCVVGQCHTAAEVVLHLDTMEVEAVDLGQEVLEGETMGQVEEDIRLVVDQEVAEEVPHQAGTAEEDRV